MGSTTNPVTQILLFQIAEAPKLADKTTKEYRIWSEALDLLWSSDGCLELAWGIGVERSEEARIHVTRASDHEHQAYLASSHSKVLSILSNLTDEPPTVRHVSLGSFTPTKSAFRAPVTGTAVYLECTPGLWDAAWNLWTHIVPGVDGCTGIAGGYVREPVDGKARGYLVYVGWESVEKHDAFHHTEEFRRNWVILNTGTTGWAEYGHVRFFEHKSAKVSAKL